MLIQCAQCDCWTDKAAWRVTRARGSSAPLYCSRACSALAKRVWETPEQKAEKKRLYDIQYRAKNLDDIRRKKADHYRENPNRERERAYREANMARHVEYCRRPEYREYKREYDRQYRAKQYYGEFWESFLIAMEIRDEALRLAGGNYELRQAKGYFDRNSQQRRRAYERLDRKEPEVGALGDLERRERR